VSPGGRALEPARSDDGAELFFQTDEAPVSLEITDTEDFVTGELRVLYPRGGYFFNPAHRLSSYDGRNGRFLSIRPVEQEAEPAQLILVQNFLEEVKARLEG
jgi:hypothetical protein